MGTQHLTEHTRDQEWRHRDMMEEEAQAEVEAKREIGANCEEIK